MTYEWFLVTYLYKQREQMIHNHEEDNAITATLATNQFLGKANEQITLVASKKINISFFLDENVVSNL